MGILEKVKKAPRVISKEITEGIRDPEHIGKMTSEMIEQELFSLENTKPMFRDQKWTMKSGTIREAIAEKISRNKDTIICQFQLKTLEAIVNQR